MIEDLLSPDFSAYHCLHLVVNALNQRAASR